jgi:CubicO group peptidase (beta-lactamase class C family)
MQKHASLSGLGAMDNAALAAELRAQLGADIALGYTQPQLAGGVFTTPAAYAVFLRKLLNRQLHMAGLLGSNPVCTNPLTCSAAVYTPIPMTESWHYALGHWVEDDPQVGDGAFSSPGAFGFYPWVDASKTYYGVVARQVLNGYLASANCGRLVRKAWLTGSTQ